MMRPLGLLAVVVVILPVGPTLAQTPPSFAAPKDLKAGFDPTILGALPATPPTPPAEAVVVVPKIWSAGIELGMSGSTGNSEVFKIRVGTKWHADFSTCS